MLPENSEQAAMGETASDDISFKLPTALDSTVDFIIKSSDDHEFRAHMTYLAAASSVFESVFLLPQKRDLVLGGQQLPMVVLSEEAGIIDVLLSCIYPVPKQRPNSMLVLTGALKAAAKYDMDAVLSTLRLHLICPPFLKANSLAVLSISLAMKFRIEAEEAFQATFELREGELLESDMGDMVGMDLARLLRARHNQAKTITTHLKSLRSSKFSTPLCDDCSSTHPWVSTWLTAAEMELYQRPMTDRIFSFDFLGRAQSNYHSSCECDIEDADWDAKELGGLKAYVEHKSPFPMLCDYFQVA